MTIHLTYSTGPTFGLICEIQTAILNVSFSAALVEIANVAVDALSVEAPAASTVMGLCDTTWWTDIIDVADGELIRASNLYGKSLR